MKQFTPTYPKMPGEGLLLSMDFSGAGWLMESESISTATWSVQVHRGQDGTPNSMISGPASIDGASVSQLVVGGLEDVVYLMLCTCVLSTSRTIIGRALLRVATI